MASNTEPPQHSQSDSSGFRHADPQKLDPQAVYAAVKVHCVNRGIDLKEWGMQQAILPDEQRWMREAIAAFLDYEGGFRG